MAEPALLKHQLAEPEVAKLAQLLVMADSSIDADLFQKQASTGLEQLELKQRVQHIITILHQHLPSDFERAAKVLFKVSELWQQNTAAIWGSFTAWPLVDYVAEAGLQQPKLALTLLKTLTPLFSAEFAIRVFIETHFELTYKTILEWAEDENEHVRRLASEGMRPRLPWGKRLTGFCVDPTPIFAVLDKLKDDGSLYVRKSVANNLNDISKDNPALVIEHCQHWWSDATERRKWIIRHGLRSLVKAGKPEVFPLLGYTEYPKIAIKQFKLNTQHIKLGENISLSLELLSQQQQKIVIDYQILFRKANGQLSAKVFKWKNLDCGEGEVLSLNKLHSFKEISTRRYYSGMHKLALLVNGTVIETLDFELQA